MGLKIGSSNFEGPRDHCNSREKVHDKKHIVEGIYV